MNKIHKFWDFFKNEDQRILRIDGVIAEDSWYEDEITPKKFKSELMTESGDITVYINSCGGDVFAASQIYNMLRDYTGKVTVKIDSIAASAASVIAMSGDEILMSPVSIMMLHDPSTVAVGNSEEMQKAIKMLGEIKEAIINAYQEKTKLSRDEISNMMTGETWLNAKKAVELGFADGILFEYENQRDESKAMIFSKITITNSILNKLKIAKKENKTSLESLNRRLYLLKK